MVQREGAAPHSEHAAGTLVVTLRMAIHTITSTRLQLQSTWNEGRKYILAFVDVDGFFQPLKIGHENNH